MANLNFNPSTDIPDLSGKVIFITGGTAGIERETVLSLAAQNPSHIFFSGRSQPSADKLIQEAQEKHPSVSLTFIRIDLSSLQSIKAGAGDFKHHSTRLDLFFANAGIMATPLGLTTDDYERQFGTNFLGHAALVTLLLPVLQTTAAQTRDVRVVWTTSVGARMPSTIDFASLKKPQGYSSPCGIFGSWLRYGQSKLAMLLYARTFAERFPGIMSVSVHPGVAHTGLADGLGWGKRAFIYAATWREALETERHAWNQMWAATAAKGVEGGVYYEPVGVRAGLMKAEGDDELARRLWEWT